MNKLLKPLKNGILDENPTLRLVLGTCPTLAVTTAAINGIGMGLSATLVLVCSNLAISLLRNIIPDKVRIPAFITIIAGFVSVVQMLVKAFLPEIDKSLGIYLPLITTNCAVLGVALLNVQNGYGFMMSIIYGTFAALGFSLAIVLFSGVREFIDERGVPEAFRGFPIALVSAGLMAIAFTGFSGFSI